MNSVLFAFLRESLTLYCKSWRIKWKNKDYLTNHISERKPAIVACWHAELLPLAFSMYKEGAVGLASQSKDGELIAKILKRWGYDAVRGSSSRGGLRALAGLKKELDKGKLVALTVDGPKGPRHIVKQGIIYLAKMTGAPVYPVFTSIGLYKTFSSWDRFVLPLPFTRVFVTATEPLYFTKDTDPEEDRLLLEKTMEERTDEAFRNPL